MAERRTGRMRHWVRCLLIALVIWSFVAWGAARALIIDAELPRADALFVLAGSSEYLERTRLAAQLFNEGRAPFIILTNDNERGGWSSEKQRNPLFVEREQEELLRAGVPAERIEVLPQPVSSTHDEAVLLREYAKTHGLHSVLVVTSAYHSRRALWTLRHALEGSGVEIGLASVPTGQQTPSPATWWLHPSGWEAVAGEYPKFIYYWLSYR